MKILLLKPKWFIKDGIYRILKNIRFTPLHLGILAALSEGHEVKVVDADWDEIPYDEKFDLVGITVTTFTSEQSYKISDPFRKAGAKVVMGGAHPSLLPSECLLHADAVVVGEAEYVWKGILADASRGTLKKIYQSDRVTDMNDIPFPRRELLGEHDWIACIQATRGCPNTCKYCYLPKVPWASYRKRDINLVYEELKSMRQEIIFFVDDNLFADEEYAIALFEKIAPLKKSWSIQAPTTIAKNERLLEVMARSGCFYVQMGFQTVNPSSLDWASIRQNRVEEYRGIITRLHKYNMIVTGFFMFGFDTDPKDIFEKTVGVVKEMNVDYVHFYILTLYPGTPLFDQFKKEGRLLENKDRSYYGWVNAMFKPKFMTPEELENGARKSYQVLYWYFAKRVFKNIFKHGGLVLRNPRLLFSVLDGVLGGKRK